MAGPIIVGVDFSDPSRRAVDAAARLAAQLGTSVALVHAFSLAPLRPVDLGSDAMDPVTALQADIAMDEAAELATTWADRVRRHGLSVQAIAREGDPVDVIVAEARRRGASLVVVGSAGRRGLRRLVLGSVAEGVVRRASCPVLVVKQRAFGLEDPPARSRRGQRPAAGRAADRHSGSSKKGLQGKDSQKRRRGGERKRGGDEAPRRGKRVQPLRRPAPAQAPEDR